MDVSIETSLKAEQLREALIALPPSHQREYLKWINEAKKPETRQRRIQKMCEMLQADLLK